jgi:hypothetical protein
MGGGGTTTMVDGEVRTVLRLVLRDRIGIRIMSQSENEDGNHSAHRLTGRGHWQWRGYHTPVLGIKTEASIRVPRMFKSHI